jgi:hypothetical protein
VFDTPLSREEKLCPLLETIAKQQEKQLVPEIMTKITQELLHKTVAICEFLENNGFKKYGKVLRKELKEETGKLPKELNGEWKWVEYDTESSSEEEEESECESKKGGEEEEVKPTQTTKNTPTKSQNDELVEIESDDDDSEEKNDDSDEESAECDEENKEKDKKVKKRLVSFKDDKNEVRVMSPRRPSEKKDMFYNKDDMKRFDRENRVRKAEEAQANLEALMKQAGATMGFSMPSFSCS